MSVFFFFLVLSASKAERENVLILNDVAKKKKKSQIFLARMVSTGFDLFKAFWQQHFKSFQATVRPGSANQSEC